MQIVSLLVENESWILSTRWYISQTGWYVNIYFLQSEVTAVKMDGISQVHHHSWDVVFTLKVWFPGEYMAILVLAIFVYSLVIWQEKYIYTKNMIRWSAARQDGLLSQMAIFQDVLFQVSDKIITIVWQMNELKLFLLQLDMTRIRKICMRVECMMEI